MFTTSCFFKKFCSLLFPVLLFISCSENDSPESELPETSEEIKDAYEYLALNPNGEIYSIGDKTGDVNYVGQIDEMQDNLNMINNAVTSSGEKIYITEQLFQPFHTRIIEYDQNLEEATVHNLELPSEFFGENAGLFSLDWDDRNEKLIATVREEIEISFGKSRVAQIDPATMEVVPLSIEIEENFINSTVLIEENLYALRSNGDYFRDAKMLEINLEAKSLREFSLTGAEANFAGILSSAGTVDFFFGFSPAVGSTFVGEATPVLIDPETKESIIFTNLPRITIRHLGRKSFYNSLSGEVVDLVYSSGEKLFKANPAEEDAALVSLDTDKFSSPTIIVGVREL